MAKYGDWTRGEDEALLNIVGGTDVARAVLRGERKLIVEAPAQPPLPVRPPLVGRVVKTIVIPAYDAFDFADAFRLGRFDNNAELGDIINLFANERVGLAKPARVDFVEFDRDWWNDEALAWGMANGNKKPIKTAHTMGIAIKLPNEQRERPIVELGSVRVGDVLYLVGGSVWRDLCRDAVEGCWRRCCLVGFLSE